MRPPCQRRPPRLSAPASDVRSSARSKGWPPISPAHALESPLRATLGARAAPRSLAGRARDLAVLQDEMRACHRCVDAGYLERADPVAGYRGRVTDRVMLIGQAPGHVSVERGLPFSGPGGRILQGWLVRAGFAPEDFRGRVYISALTRCDPGRAPRGGGDRKPSPPEVALCRPYLLRELALVRPRIIVLVGAMAIAAFLGPRRLEDVIGEGFEEHGAHLLPLPHPSGVSRWLNDPKHQALLTRALDRLAAWRVEPDAAGLDAAGLDAAELDAAERTSGKLDLGRRAATAAGEPTTIPAGRDHVVRRSIPPVRPTPSAV